MSGLEQHLTAILQDTGASDLGVTASVKHSAAMQQNEVATRLNTAALSDQIGKLVQDWQETNNAAGAKALDANAAKQQLEALQLDINALLQHSGASRDGISITLQHAQALLTNTTNAKEQAQALQDAIRGLFQHTQATQQGTPAVVSHTGALNLNRAALDVQTDSLVKSVTQFLLHNVGLRMDAQHLTDLVSKISEHAGAMNADLPVVISHSGALTANASAAKNSTDAMAQKVLALLQHTQAGQTDLPIIVGHTAALAANAGGAKIDAEAIGEAIAALAKQQSVVGPVVDMIKIHTDDTVADTAATLGWLGPLGLSATALDAQKVATDGASSALQIVYGHANDTSSAVNTLTKANKDLADQTQQTTQATQIWSSVLHDIPWWEGGTGSTMLTGNELALEFQDHQDDGGAQCPIHGTLATGLGSPIGGGCFRGIGCRDGRRSRFEQGGRRINLRYAWRSSASRLLFLTRWHCGYLGMGTSISCGSGITQRCFEHHSRCFYRHRPREPHHGVERHGRRIGRQRLK